MLPSIPMNPESDLAHRWRRIARRVSARVNLAWWLQTLSGPLLLVGITGAFALLLIRRGAPGIPAESFAAWTIAALALLALACWWIARRHFESADASMVRIEDKMHLHSSLSAARAGVAPWPPVPEKIDAGLRWNWKRVLVAPIAALSFLAAGNLLPLPAAPRDLPGSEPIAWGELEEDLDLLEQEDIADEEYLEEMRERIEELRSRDKEEWFEHASLEATDSLEDSHRRELERFERELSRMDRTLGNFRESAGTIDSERREQLLEQFDQSLLGLESGSLKPNAELLERLGQLDPGQLSSLSAEQVAELRRKLQKSAQACKECQGEGDPGAQGAGDGKMAGSMPSKGGISRGPGHAGGVLGDPNEQLETGELEPLASLDPTDSLPGDLLGLQDSEPEVDRSESSRSGGTIGNAGIGGDRVWRESLDPDEQRALKRYFE